MNNHLTGPEYEIIYNILTGFLEYKQINEGDDFFKNGLKEKNYNRTPVFTTTYSKKIIKDIIDKMGKRMDEFDPDYRHTCW